MTLLLFSTGTRTDLGVKPRMMDAEAHLQKLMASIAKGELSNVKVEISDSQITIQMKRNNQNHNDNRNTNGNQLTNQNDNGNEENNNDREFPNQNRPNIKTEPRTGRYTAEPAYN